MTTIQVHDTQGVRVLKFNRPDKRNAIDLGMYQQLTEYLIQGDSDNGIHAFLLCGNSDCFTSGNDVAEFLQHPDLGPEHPAVRFLYCLTELKKPLLAAVSGAAIGIGTTLLLHCDLVYADETARFKMPFVDLALVPEAGASLLLPQLVGYQKAAELLLLSTSFDAVQAHQLGLVNQVVNASQLYDFALSQAVTIAAKSPNAVQQTKALMRIGKQALQQQMQQELACFGERLQSPQARATFLKFLQR
ncbi:enoyl-CoA hydratase-related protein [Shewanella dokdonensis]|uniref:Enoyl-CoA hydratase/isomerase family protein n=1 Tax=Shewanella dokdonensis TaxID=712036 RepID=A0ABX8DC10_9GAMM|nr:enoyl-CoA hydratase-related protein [Shewanella dokdonensis]MCL1074810.1 enoyl-CoA hydratase-related protein [Shewanella dokdonensis]QVK22216.1 enoyl-CoA hydratase/isomerase family protein [Shewanella dokdonensis]